MKSIRIVRLVYFFFRGLERNFKIINYGEVPDIYITPVHLEKYHFASGSFLSYFSIVKNLYIQLLDPFYKCYVLQATDVVYCGGSTNNEREFLFFNNLLSSNVPSIAYSKDTNLSFVRSVRKRKKGSDWTVSIIIYIITCIYLFRIKICPTSYKYLSVYSKIFLQVLCSFYKSSVAPKLAVVANDHTDFPVAFSMVMKYIGASVAYIQHAEVTAKFPFLDFDISILRNQKTLEIYQNIGPVTGSVFIIPRSERSTNFTKIFDDIQEPVKVVIYLSSIFNITKVNECLSALTDNKKVDRIFIKRHPRVRKDQLQVFSNINILCDIPHFKHIAIVPNSSVVIELLQQGIKVFQYFNLDGVNEDYYGLVKDGITLKINLKDLSGSFWDVDFYNDVWLSRFKNYSPELDSNRIKIISDLEDSVRKLVHPQNEYLGRCR